MYAERMLRDTVQVPGTCRVNTQSSHIGRILGVYPKMTKLDIHAR